MEPQIIVTPRDVEEKPLLLRLLRKMADANTDIRTRLGKIERLPSPPTASQIRDQLQANGSAPLNVQSLPGLLQQPQLASAPRSTSAPTGPILQQLRDTQLVLVGSTSTGFALNTVVGGNPNVLYQLIGSLTTSSIGSTSTNLMTLDTTQAVTTGGIKTVNAGWTFTQSQTIVSTADVNLNLTIKATSTTGVTAQAALLLTNDLASFFMDAHTAPRVVSRYGLTLGGWGEITAQSGYNGIVIGTQTTGAPFVLGTANAERARIDGDGNLNLNKKIVKYNSITTTGEGVPYIIARDAQISKTSSVGLTTLYTTTTTGEYRLSYCIECIATGTSLPILTYFYSNDAASRSAASTGLALTNVGLEEQRTIFLRNGSGSAIQYNVAFATATSTVAAGTYSVFTLLERLT